MTDTKSTDIRVLIAELVEKDLAKPTIKVIISALTAVMSHAVEDEIIAKNPALKCSQFFKHARARSGEIQPLSATEAALLLQTILNEKRLRKHYCLFLLLLHTGLRSSEAAGLRWGFFACLGATEVHVGHGAVFASPQSFKQSLKVTRTLEP